MFSSTAQLLDRLFRGAYTGLMDRQAFGVQAFRIAGALSGLCLLAGCSSDYAGPMLRLSGNFNRWAKGERAAALQWDGSAGVYRGVVALPGDSLQFSLYSPYTQTLVGAASAQAEAVPGTVDTAAQTEHGQPFRLDTPLSATYEVSYDPDQHRLHLDLAAGAEEGQPEAAARLIQALRGSAGLSFAERARRAAELNQYFTGPEKPVETPVRSGSAESASLTFLHLGPVDYPEVALVGNFNNWSAEADRLHFMLDGTVAYLAKQASGTRLEYRFERHGLRYADLHNLEVAWDGAYLPPDLHNLLGGNVGEFNSVAVAAGYAEQGSRLRRLVLDRQPGVRDVYVYLPPGYRDDAQPYPSLYIHDGKDAIVRGRYTRTLDDLIARRRIPALLGVFIPAQPDVVARYREFARFPDPYFLPQPDDRQVALYVELVRAVMRRVEQQYHASPRSEHRAMLGIDLAAPLSFDVLWSAPGEPEFRRVVSQSGRFGWGDPREQPYLKMLQTTNRGKDVLRLSFDWAAGDNFQVGANEALEQLFISSDAYQGKVRFYRQETSQAMASLWDNWRARLEDSLNFVFQDLVP